MRVPKDTRTTKRDTVSLSQHSQIETTSPASLMRLELYISIESCQCSG
jgi:hypothetical protein